MTADLRTIARETGKPAWSFGFQLECNRQLTAAGVDPAEMGEDDRDLVGQYFRDGKTPDAFVTDFLARMDDAHFRRDLPLEDR